MIKLKELLNLKNDSKLEELLEDSFKDDLTVDEINEKSYKFEIGGLQYRIDLTLSLTSQHKKIVEFKFYLLNNPKSPKKTSFMSDREFEIIKQKTMLGITGTGNQFRVINYVKSALKLYLKSNRPDYITFTADEENRQSMYRRILNKVLNQFPDYKNLTINPLTNQPLTEQEFWLERKHD